jgi:putative cell wall-binding protein/protocatechuate 3,4-dioxygenase beta subunit
MVAITTMLSLVAIPLPASASVTPSAEPGWGTVSGIVKDPYGVPITGNFDSDYVIMVEAWQWDGGAWNQVFADEWGNDFQVSYTTGEYAFDLPAGTYKLHFYDWFNKWSNSGYRDKFYPNSYTVAGASNVVVTDQGTTTANMTLAMWEHGSIAGVVTDSTDGSKVSGISISAYTQDGFGNWNWDGMWGATSLSLGDWKVDQVPVGRYKIEFTDYDYRYKSQWYGGGTDIDSAAWMNVAPMHVVSGVNVSMVRLGHIKGRITDSGGNGIAGIGAIVLSGSAGNWNEVSEGSHQKVTDSGGYYDYIGLEPGTYRIVFYDMNGRYLTKAFGGADTPGGTVYDAANTGTNIVVGVGGIVTGKDAVLASSARILGHVQNNNTSEAIPWADVSIYDSATGAYRGMTQTDEHGDYVLGNLVSGTYKVRFDFAGDYVADFYPESATGYYYNRQFYSGKTTTATANPITLAAGTTYATPIDASLVPTTNWGTVGARITGPNGSELSGIPVAIDYWDGFYWERDTVLTDYTGRVSFKYVPAGKMVRLRINDPASGDYNSGWSDSEAINGAVVGGTTWTGSRTLTKSAADWSGAPLGLMWGKVRDAVTSGNIAAVPVTTYVYDSFSDEYWWDRQMTADSAGWFEIPVPTGAYIVEAGPTLDYAAEFYNNAGAISSATSIAVTAPSTTSLVQMPLDRAHKITGTILDKNGQGLRNAYVSAYKYNSDWEAWQPVTYDGATNAFTAANGTYTLGGLASGTYRLVAFSWFDELGFKGWKASGEAQSIDQADNVVLSGSASTHPGYNMTLTPAAKLRGSVTDGDAKRVTGVHVKLWWDDPAGSWALINSTYTYHDGDFEFSGFSAGGYFLEFIDDTNYLYEDSWYKSVPTSSTAAAVQFAHAESKVVTQTVVSVDTAYSPVFGPTRIETAIMASLAAFPDGAKTVVISTGYNWPDALGGAALAGAYDGPILLTNPTYLPYQVADEIDRLGASDAIILGSSAAVGNPVESALKSTLGAAHVRRLAGANRYETAVKVAEETIDRLGDAYDGTAFISTGENFPDALGASPLAAASNWPIYLTAKDSLTESTKNSMATHRVTKAIILGSAAAVAPAVESSLDAFLRGADATPRLGGANRYETAVIVAQYGVDHVYGLGWNNVAFATGENYPDALAGGVLQGQAGSVLLLTPTDSLNPSVAAKLAAVRDKIAEVRYLGSTKAVSNATRVAIQKILK